MAEVKPEWSVLLIGGSSGTGKTAVGQEISKQFGIPLLLLDDIRLAIQAVTTLDHYGGYL